MVRRQRSLHEGLSRPDERGTVGGALRHNAGERSTEIGQFVRSVDVMDLRGNIQTREQDELRRVVAL